MSKQIIDIGIAESSRVEIADGLSRLLADTYTLYIKTHYYHWNVTGPMFNSLHLMFENQYNELATAVDDIAERIRSLGCFAPGTYHEFSRLTAVNEDKDIPAAKNMIENLVQGQETVVKTARSLFPIVNSGNDEATADLLTQRIQLHEKTAWMLRSLLE
ncbi:MULTISPECIES: Dps family protein [Enterobacterales]|jgi:starvation-inducible DNA-binding protein|uniref:DNA starvation/stationary phase protection protein n=11 Tax=Enterobacteriaceae TaxID=543 RepID=A0AAE5DUL9_CITFR|nr:MULTISPECIES: Dps family protein [Enterobacterales]EAB6152809.1 DNA starvation/stationary phase protection protein [Salmonella enterica]EBC9802004.1 DNA starvation/stationary phase protection protein [Salmonella enterica subsp. enterica serovar Senftenberg]EBM1761468.1 DNA starvation/stationary phase protection protein [Salmonella enterica subsp. enterica serovar Montevideo]EBV0459843.1 DNA starvation/stationary phase protection protein [Salmonella enterica subsp. enterica serovar Virchow]E